MCFIPAGQWPSFSTAAQRQPRKGLRGVQGMSFQSHPALPSAGAEDFAFLSLPWKAQRGSSLNRLCGGGSEPVQRICTWEQLNSPCPLPSDATSLVLSSVQLHNLGHRCWVGCECEKESHRRQLRGELKTAQRGSFGVQKQALGAHSALSSLPWTGHFSPPNTFLLKLTAQALVNP